MDLLLVVLGLLVVAAVLVDMFQTLLYPSGDGWLSSPLMGLLWKLSRRLRHPMGTATGTVAMVTVILTWVALQVLGWALVYFPYVPDGFSYSPGIVPAGYPDFAEALYLSLVAIGTLGLGDVVGVGPWLRFALPLQALTGFALLTAALTWFSQIEGPLLRRRGLASELRSLGETGEHLARWDPASTAGILHGLVQQIVAVRIDFEQHSEQFYFPETDPDASLGRQLGHAVALRDAALASADVTVHDAGARLGVALEELAASLSEQFLHTDGSVAETLAAYRAEHAI